MRHILLLLLSLTILTSCQDDDDVRTDIRIRVENRTDTDLRDFVLLPNFNTTLTYGTIASGGLTGYQFTETADDCSFGYSMITGGNDTIAQSPPLCFVASPLADGDYKLVMDSIVTFEQRTYFTVLRFERE